MVLLEAAFRKGYYAFVQGISIIIPFYNAYATFGKLYHSIKSQESVSLPYEIIVVDDCSPAPPEENYFGQFPDVKIIHLNSNKGPMGARLIGAAEATYENILFFDADDELAPSFFQSASPILESDYSFILFYAQNDDGTFAAKLRNGSGPLSEPDVLSCLFLNGKSGYTCCKIIRKDLFKGFSVDAVPRMFYLEDSLLNVLLFSRLNHSAYYIDKPLAFWHATATSLSRRADGSFFDCLCTVLKAKQKLVKLYSDVFAPIKCESIINLWFCDSLCEIYCKCLRNKRRKEANAKLKSIRRQSSFWAIVSSENFSNCSFKTALFLFCYRFHLLWLFGIIRSLYKVRLFFSPHNETPNLI